jgi:V8-like Glu-specific endopeptidase
MFSKLTLLSSLFFLSTIVVSAANFDAQKSICGSDDRVLSSNPKVGRLLKDISSPGGCTGTLISKSCIITAGHCTSTFGIIEFNTPESQNGSIQHPDARDIYEIDKSFIKYKNRGQGQDYAVLKVKPNKVTGAYPGHVQGNYQVTFDRPSKNIDVIITGYGLDRGDAIRNLAQQTHSGQITSIARGIIRHKTDTMGGNSGSSIIRKSDGKVIGIHTHGGCSNWGGSNAGTLIHGNQELIGFIKQCLESDR